MRRQQLLCSVLILAASGCSAIRVRVDARLAPEPELQQKLDGPAYVIKAADEQAEASLAFQEFANTFAHAMEMYRPDLERVGTSEPADFAVLLHVTVADLGAGVVSYPILGSQYGRGFGPCGPVYYRSYGVVGTEVRTVHYGYDHVLSAMAYIQDASAPAGRRVLWEGMAGLVDDANDIDQAMPYLAIGLASQFGQPTEGRRSVKLSSRDDQVRYLRRWVRTGVRPATQPGDEED